jgi:hypothetical protein
MVDILDPRATRKYGGVGPYETWDRGPRGLKKKKKGLALKKKKSNNLFGTDALEVQKRIT